MQCCGITKLRLQCSRLEIPGSNYCWQHQNTIHQIDETKESIISESKKILELERERLSYFDIKEANLFLSKDIKFKDPEIENIILNYPITDLLNYKVINYLLTLFQQKLEYDFSKFSYPFVFSSNSLYGLQLENTKEFYKYLFVSSLKKYIKNNTKISDNSIFKKFGIIEDMFDLKNLKYENRCTDPNIFIRSNLPIIYPTLDYTYYPTLFDIMDISFPNADVQYWFQTGKYSYGFDNTMLDYFNQKYNFVDKNLKTQEQIYSRYLKLFFQYSVDPGFNTQILANKKIPSIQEFEILKNKIPLINNDRDARKWSRDHKLWRQKNIGIDIFTYHELSRYQNYSSTRINENCRSDEFVSKDNLIIIKSFNFSVPLETNIVVHRIIHLYKGLSSPKIYKGEGDPTEYIITETALMSTSINYEPYQVENISKGSKRIIFTLYVTAGTCCIPTYVAGSENELIFPPGTQYILYDKKLYEKRVIHYTGVIIT